MAWRRSGVRFPLAPLDVTPYEHLFCTTPDRGVAGAAGNRPDVAAAVFAAADQPGFHRARNLNTYFPRT